MRRLLLLLLAILPLYGQDPGFDGYLRVLRMAPRISIESRVKALDESGITLNGNGLMGWERWSAAPAIPASGPPGYASPQLRSQDGEGKYLGNLNSNRFDPDSVSNPFGRYGSRFSPESVHNPYGPYGSPYSPYSARNPYATQAPAIVTPEGKYLGKFSANPYDPDSVSNPHGRFGSPYSPDSVNNPFGQYGSPYSPASVRYPSAPTFRTLPKPGALPMPGRLPSTTRR